jgi:hypothetical protein
LFVDLLPLALGCTSLMPDPANLANVAGRGTSAEEVLQTRLDSMTHGTAEGACLAADHQSCRLSYGDEQAHRGEHLVSINGCQPAK